MKSIFGVSIFVFNAGFVCGAQFVLFLHVIPERLDDDQIRSQKSHSIITINGLINVWKCKLIFHRNTLQQKIQTADLKPFFIWRKTSALIILASVYNVILERRVHGAFMGG